MKPFLCRKPQNLGIDITPLMDIVFQLLLFFILTSAMLQPSLPLELPGSKEKSEGTEADLIISINAEGEIFLNDTLTPLEMVESAIFALAGENPEAAVVLRGDRQVRYGRFFELLDIIRGAGIKTLDLAYDEEGQ
jgi:biopolymer transport protein ExbD